MEIFIMLVFGTNVGFDDVSIRWLSLEKAVDCTLQQQEARR